MSVRLSHSAMNKFQTCAKSYQYRYIDRIVPVAKSSALFFGVAIDEALNHLLKYKDSPETILEAQEVFARAWEQQKDNEGNIVDLPMNPQILYSKYDYDSDMMEKSDWRELFQLDDKAFETRGLVEEALKKNTPWGEIPEKQRIVYNFMSWLSLKRKAILLLDAYHKQLLPNIKEIVAIQMELNLTDDAGNSINGFIDLVAKLQDGTIAVLDNKTSSMEYEADSVKKSTQLALYQNILNSYCDDPAHPWKHRITKCGYLVMSKKINKEKTKICKKCGHQADEGARHKTCAQEINEVRCGGDFDVTKKFNVNTQIIVDQIETAMLELVMENADTIRTAIDTSVFPRNLTVCHSIFGKPCEYIGFCHKGETNGLAKLPDKK